jgi:thioredoxin reductase (NADPH)
MSCSEFLDVAIIGAGPAGLTAALYAGRARLKTKVLEKLVLGGQVLLTETIENYPGIYKMNSFDWVEALKKQLADLSDVLIAEEMRVERIEKCDGFFKVFAVSGASGARDVLEAKCVIVATGAQPRRLGIKGEEAFVGRGVSYCATCDGPLFKGKEVVLIGGGDTAIEEALFLRKFAARLTIVHRRDALRAAAILQERVKNDRNISIKWNAVPVEVLGKTRVEGLRIRDVKTDAQEVLPCDGIFVFIGFDPDTVFLKDFVKLNAAGYAATDENMMTSCAGIFATGDCRARPLNQVVTACSDGAIAACSVIKFLENKAY